MKLTPKNEKYIKIAAGCVAVLVLYKMLVPKSDTSGSIDDPTGNGGTPSTPGYVFNAKKVANELLIAMREMGTDEDAIVSALTPVNATQFSQVITAFGNQPYNSTTGNQYIYIPFTSLPKRNLQYWLKNELSTQRYNILKMKYPQLS